VHPGYAKGKMVNAVRIIGDIVRELENDPSPEITEKREGYLHPYVIEGGVEKSVLKILIRDFDMEGMEAKSARLRSIRDRVAGKHPRGKIDLEIKESYRNMRLKLDEDPRVADFAMEAVRRAGLQPRRQVIRGGTDGAKLCFQGLLTPNLFAGGQNFHSKQEWVSVQVMEKAVETLIHLVQIWAKAGAA
jgi:tripeptide aminopeptidase